MQEKRHTKLRGSAGSLYVRRISVRGLFGQFDYDLRPGPGTSAEPSKLMILYGDNGSGKTTLLRMLFHMLHPAPNEGHRTVLARSIFKRFEVTLGEDTSVIAERPRGKDTGEFRMRIERGAHLRTEVDWKLSAEGGIRGTRQGEDAEREFMRALAGLNLALYYLRDDREMKMGGAAGGVSSDIDSRLEAEMLGVARDRFLERRRRRLARQERGPVPPALEIAIRRASSWALKQTLRASTKGDEDVNAIYAGIISRLARPATAALRKPPLARQKLAAELEALAQRTLEFSQYGMIAPADATAIIDSIQVADSKVLPMIREVVSPYLDGLRARLDALQKARDRIDAFVSIVNGFYSHKRLVFHLREGLSIETGQGNPLPSRALSSGERQLLLMFCSLLVASDVNEIFIVDEPELSLNVKWQRQLTTALLRLAAETSTQFVLATHSIALLTRHKGNVVTLSDTRLRREAR